MSVTIGQCYARPTSPPIGWYQIILLGDMRYMCVNNLPRVALDSWEVGIQTCDKLIVSPASYPVSHRTSQTFLADGKMHLALKTNKITSTVSHCKILITHFTYCQNEATESKHYLKLS